MTKLIVTLAPVFAAGFAVQQLLEILTSFLNLDSKPTFEKYKKAILGAVALAVGLTLAIAVDLKVLKPLLDLLTDPQGQPVIHDFGRAYEYVVTGLVISAGTEGVNSIMKFLQYAKDNVKKEA